MTLTKRIEGRIAQALAGLSPAVRERAWVYAFGLLCQQRRRWAWVICLLPPAVIGS